MLSSCLSETGVCGGVGGGCGDIALLYDNVARGPVDLIATGPSRGGGRYLRVGGFVLVTVR